MMYNFGERAAMPFLFTTQETNRSCKRKTGKGNRMMSIEVRYEPRFRVETESYINNYDNYSMHNNYEYHSYLKRYLGPYQDQLYFNGKFFSSGTLSLRDRIFAY